MTQGLEPLSSPFPPLPAPFSLTSLVLLRWLGFVGKWGGRKEGERDITFLKVVVTRYLLGMVTPSSWSSGLLSSLQPSFPFLTFPRTPNNPTQGEMKEVLLGQGGWEGEREPVPSPCILLLQSEERSWRCWSSGRSSRGQNTEEAAASWFQVLCEWLRCYSDAVAVFITSICHVFLLQGAVWCLLGRSTALSWLAAYLLLKEAGHVSPFLLPLSSKWLCRESSKTSFFLR